MRRTYKYRLYPTRKQATAFSAQLGFNCDLYNAGLQQRRDAYRLQRKSLSYFDQVADLTELRADGLSPEMNCWTQQHALRRLDLAFAAFFRRLRQGTKPGFPRYRAKSRYNTLTWSFSGNAGGVTIQDGRLRLQGIGHVKVKWHRALPSRASLKTASIIRRSGRWELCISLGSEATGHLSLTRPPVGLDLGISSFVALSTGELVSGPRSYRAAQRLLRVAQRRLSRRVRGSGRRVKARQIVARLHEHTAHIRRDHQHKLSRRLVNQFGFIAVEDLNIKGLTKGILSKDIHDQGWSSFISMLEYKAEGAGTQVVKVNPAHTSQLCSTCGALVPKDLSVRVHRCLCGYVADRDVNAARNVLNRGLGLSLQASIVAVAAIA